MMKTAPRIKEIDAPKVILLPHTIELTGEVYSELPMERATVDLEMAGLSATTTMENERFKAELYLPLKFNIMGFQEAKLSIKPSEPWHLPTNVKTRIFVLNSASLGAILVVLASLGVVLTTRRRREKGREDKPTSTFPKIERLVKSAPEKSKAMLEGTKETILETYFAALEIVERVTTFPMKPQMTLREFLNQTRPSIGNAADAFAELTILAEKILYSSYTPGKDESIKAEKSASKIKEMCSNGKP